MCLLSLTLNIAAHLPIANCLRPRNRQPIQKDSATMHARLVLVLTDANRDTGVNCLAMTCSVMNCVLSHLNTPLQMISFPCRKNGNTHGGVGAR